MSITKTAFKNEPEVIVKSIKSIDVNKTYKHVKHFLKALHNNTSIADVNIDVAGKDFKKSNSINHNSGTLTEFEDSFHDDLKNKLSVIVASLKEYKAKRNDHTSMEPAQFLQASDLELLVYAQAHALWQCRYH